MSRIKVAILFGGRSGEHEVSRNSAFSVAKALSHSFELFPIGISKDGEWYGPIPIQDIPDFSPEKFPQKNITILPTPQSNGTIYSLPDLEPLLRVHVFFPILHGTFGEDGTIQGLLELAQVPYVGAGVLSSAMSMDKVIMKKIFAHAGLPQVAHLSFSRSTIENSTPAVIREIEKTLGYPCFVKPANLGSSVGITKNRNKEELRQSLNLAARYGRKIIVEKGVTAREVEVSVLGNDAPIASLPGEIVPCNEFYDYDAKYKDDRTRLYIPAQLEEEQIKILQEYAIRAYQAIDCEGLARIDFFITKDNNEILINEINTLPGFTSVSMYPKLWEHSGIPMEELTRRLVELALERARDTSRNVTTYGN